MPHILQESLREGKEYKSNGLSMKREQLQSLAQLQLSETPYPIASGVYASGRIPRVVPFEVPQEKYPGGKQLNAGGR